MILKKVHVTNYRCVEDSGLFSVGAVTCFVGKNESGKTALLQALERLKPVDATHTKYDKLTDYPRKWLSEYDEHNPDGEARVLKTHWQMNDADAKAVIELVGENALASHDFTVSKGYGSAAASFGVHLNHAAIVEAMFIACGCTPEEQVILKKLGTAGSLAEYVTNAPAPLSPGLAQLKERLGKFRDHNYERGVIDALYERMPSFLYFSNYDRMSGRVSIDDLEARRARNNDFEEGQRIFLEFLDFARISLNDIRDAKKSEDLRARCEAASINISKQIFEYWSQNRHLKVDFVVESGRPEDPAPFNNGFVMQARVRNQLHDMTVPFSERSAGFVWFFSFLVHFSQVKKQQGNVIILLDEPGLALHAKAQTDLLRYFDEKLKPNHQVLYTTHSPFMVPPSDLLSVRTVEDVVEERHGVAVSKGTHVGDDVLSTDRDTLFPLQAALGYELTQGLFVGEHTLLVEGPSDYLYFSAFSEELKRLKRTALDPRWTICPTGGVDKVPAFVSLFGGNKLDIAVGIDYVKGQKAKVESLRTSTLLKAGRVLTFAEITGKAEADVEDMLGVDLYVSILNAGFELTGKETLTAAGLGVGAADRLLPKVEDAFRVMPGTVASFDHYKPAAFLIANMPAFAGAQGMSDALARFEALFQQLNAML